MAETNKPTTSGASGEQIKPASPFKAIFPLLAIIVCAVIAHVAFYKGFGHYSNFKNGEKLQQDYQAWVDAGEVGEAPPTPQSQEPANNYGLVYKGGFVIPIVCDCRRFFPEFPWFKRESIGNLRCRTNSRNNAQPTRMWIRAGWSSFAISVETRMICCPHSIR